MIYLKNWVKGKNMSEFLPKIKKEGIFEKIKKWFKISFKGKIVEEEIKNEKLTKFNMNEKSTNEYIKNNNKIFILQKRLKEGLIEISDLTDEELDEIIELYKKQVEEKKNKLRFYRNKIIKNKRSFENE